VGLVNRPIPSFVGGVSQQPPSIRHPSQVEKLENMVPSIAAGLRRRAGTKHVSALPTGNYTNAFVHTIDRGTAGSTDERYHVVIDQGDLKVFDFNGAQRTVSFPNGKAYLTSAIPPGTPARESFSATSVADFTFIANKFVKPALTPHTPGTIPQRLYVIVKVGVVNSTYTITLDGTPYSYTIGDGAGVNKTTTIAAGLAALIPGGFTATVQDNLITIAKAADAAFTWAVSDSYGNQALFAFTDQVNRYEQLPAIFVEGRVIQVKGDPNNSDTSFYVLWQKRDTDAGGVWIEYVANNIDCAIDPTTMPCELIRNSDGTFTFQQAAWKAREVGDEKSAPKPSFIGSPIQEVFFTRNRLGFLADENAIMSAVGDYFEFWPATVRAVLDSDPIDISASTTKVTFLRHVVPFQKTMMVLSDKMQFRLIGEPTLTPKSARLDPSTLFEVDPRCKPALMGRNIYFPTPRGDFTALREYYYDELSIGDDAEDTTAHVPAYIPQGVFRLSAGLTENQIFALTTQERNAIYIYNVFFSGNQKDQSAWHKWVFDPSDVILSADVFGTTMALLIQRGDTCYFETLELNDLPTSPASYTMCLDRWKQFGSGTYDPRQKMTFWTLPYTLPLDAVPVVVLLDAPGAIEQGLIPDFYGGNSIGLKGDYHNTNVVIGTKYLSLVRLSEQFYRDPKSEAIIAGRLQLRDIVIQFARAGFFQVRVSPRSRDVSTYTFSGKPLGLSALTLGIEVIQAGSFRASIMARSSEVDIDFINDSHLPGAYLSAEWIGNLAMQAQRQ